MTGVATTDLSVDLRLEHNDQTISVHGTGRGLTADASEMRIYIELVQALVPGQSVFTSVKRSSRLLAQHGLALKICVAEAVVAQCGENARSWMLRLLGMPHVRLRRPYFWLKYLIRRRQTPNWTTGKGISS